ncbi:MAG: hypothetical protein A3H24_00500 [Rhodoferax sp. RIFCSPLOWO2_12_FULL_60_11]|nr:MAG: hypothetical protein A3H24_00500 [Rhodoferax sp. RIFCSPLOWO2_12_FULL_60_11]
MTDEAMGEFDRRSRAPKYTVFMQWLYSQFWQGTKKRLKSKGCWVLVGTDFFCTADARAEATATEWAGFETRPCDRDHPWDIKLPNDEAAIELIWMALGKLMADLRRVRPQAWLLRPDASLG